MHSVNRGSKPVFLIALGYGFLTCVMEKSFAGGSQLRGQDGELIPAFLEAASSAARLETDFFFLPLQIPNL